MHDIIEIRPELLEHFVCCSTGSPRLHNFSVRVPEQGKPGNKARWYTLNSVSALSTTQKRSQSQLEFLTVTLKTVREVKLIRKGKALEVV